ncbi:MBL fold metallo-hydrolase [Pelomonas sp. KK5]|uniref:MBL fold metallo-hydrolase n=1 Tax=Pelomonas sp. KK5 TaxID=1855730 RepID=UPI00097BB47F|nr:MBL fold metallo-hydrolase [Pelomonas sp. KK5]
MKNSKILLCAAAVAMAVFSTTATLAPTAALAAAPMAKTQAPGFYRLQLGSFEITALNDGFFDLPVDKLLKQPPEKTEAALAKYFQKVPVETSVNAFLINTGSKLVLVDTGTGGKAAASAGVLLANLAAAGYKPEQIDAICITHNHGDHLGGLTTKDGVPVFPNATVHIGKADAEADSAKATLAPYAAAKKLAPIEADGEIVPGVRAWATHGHTAGHTSYVVESGGQKLIILGDLIHVAAVQMDDPAVTITFDADSSAAAAQRDKVFKTAAADGTIIAAAHLQFPGMGRLRANGAGWTYVPVNYQRMR